MASRFTDDEDFSKALNGPLYTQIREAFYSINKSNRSSEGLRDPKSDLTNLPEEHLTKSKLDDSMITDHKAHSDNHTNEPPLENVNVTDRGALCEIEEVETEDSQSYEDQAMIKTTPVGSHVRGKRNVFIRSEVEQALGTLEKAISIVREYGLNAQMQSSSAFTYKGSPKRSNSVVDSKSTEEEDGVCSNVKVHVEALKTEVTERRPSSESLRNSFGVHSSR